MFPKRNNWKILQPYDVYYCNVIYLSKFHHLKLPISCQKVQILLICGVSKTYSALLTFTHFNFTYRGITGQYIEYSVFKRLVM